MILQNETCVFCPTGYYDHTSRQCIGNSISLKIARISARGFAPIDRRASNAQMDIYLMLRK